MDQPVTGLIFHDPSAPGSAFHEITWMAVRAVPSQFSNSRAASAPNISWERTNCGHPTSPPSRSLSSKLIYIYFMNFKGCVGSYFSSPSLSVWKLFIFTVLNAPQDLVGHFEHQATLLIHTELRINHLYVRLHPIFLFSVYTYIHHYTVPHVQNLTFVLVKFHMVGCCPLWVAFPLLTKKLSTIPSCKFYIV